MNYHIYTHVNILVRVSVLSLHHHSHLKKLKKYIYIIDYVNKEIKRNNSFLVNFEKKRFRLIDPKHIKCRTHF